MLHQHNYGRHETWRWWQRLKPHGLHWSGMHRADLIAHAYYPWWKKAAHVFIPHERNGFKPHAVRHRALAVYSIVLIAAKVGLSLGLFLTFPAPAHFSSLTAQRIITLTNEARMGIGIPPLQENDLLRTSATLKAEQMAHEGYFAHVNPKGESPWEWFKRVDYVYTYAGENLAMDFNNAEEVVEAWMESPKHRENILNPKYKDIGLAVTTGTVNGRTVTLVVQHFGTSFGTPSTLTFGARSSVAVQEGQRPAVAAAATEARLQGSATRSWWDDAINVFTWTAGIFALWLILQLILTMFVQINIQHRGIIYATVVVIGLAVGLLSLQVHFLEQVGGVPIVF